MVGDRRIAGRDRLDCQPDGQALAGFPAVKGVTVVGQQVQQLRIAVVKLEYHRRAEAAQDGRHRFGVHVHKAKALTGFGQHHGARAGHGGGFTAQLQGQVGAVSA